MPEYLPTYASAPLRRFSAYLKESDRLLHLSMRGISMLRAMPDVLEALAPWNEDSSEVTKLDKSVSDDETHPMKTEIETAKEEAGFAEKEVTSGFPLLHAHTLVGLWSAVEASIEDMLVAILLNEPVALESPVFSKLRVSLAEFERFGRAERMRFLLSEILRLPGNGGKQGADRFEVLLEPFGLSGPIEADVKKLMWEAHHLRNIIVHRAGFPDQRFITACPWVKVRPKEPVQITHIALRDYGVALAQYLLTIAHRLGVRYDVDIDARIRASQEPDKPNSETREH
jgi:hypothetical protein